MICTSWVEIGVPVLHLDILPQLDEYVVNKIAVLKC